MTEKEILELEYSTFVDYLAGLIIIGLGRGEKLKDLVGINVQWTIFWLDKNRKKD